MLIRRIRNIEKAGGSVVARTADVCDAGQIRDIVSSARHRFGFLNGVFHLAGLLDDGLIELKTGEAAQKVLRPKLEGTLALLAALEGMPLDFIVLFSSLSSIIGLAGQVDYTAANSFLNAFARHKRDLQSTRIVAIDWGMWEDVGMAAESLREVKEADSAPPADDVQTRTQFIEVGVETHWVLNEHRRKDGLSVMPGTGYIELARTAFAGGRRWVPVEIRDVYFLAPMSISGLERRSLRLQFEGDEHFSRFSFASKPLDGAGQNGGWQRHVTGSIFRSDDFESKPYDLQAVIRRCPDKAELKSREAEHQFWSFGPRWASLKEIRFGQREALMVLEMPSEYIAELDEYPLHPALLDMATGELVTQFGNCSGLFVPFSYGRIRGYKPLEPLLYCHIRYHQSSFENSPIAAFDVTIANASGEVLADVNDFLMKRVEDSPEADFADHPKKNLSRETARRPAAAQGSSNPPQLFRYGIPPKMGIEALERILNQPHLSQVIVSPMDLNELIADNRVSEADREVQGLGAKKELLGKEKDMTGLQPEGVADTIIALWQETLGVDKVGEDQDFFVLGGNSLSMVQVAAQLRERFRLNLPLSALMEQSTIAHWTRVVKIALEADGRLQG
jgi:acyl carrier protein